MKLISISIGNFRRFDTLSLDIDAKSTFLIAQNAGGKTSVLVAIARALGRDLSFERADFLDPAQPIELVATLGDLSLNQQAVLADRVVFGPPHTVEVGVLATWDTTSEQIDVTHGYPKHGWARSSREERDALPLIWMPAWRDPSRMLAFGATQSLISLLLEQLPLTAVQQALTEVLQGAKTLGADPVLRGLLDDAGTSLGKLIPHGGSPPFDLGISAVTERELLRQFELLLQYDGPSIPVARQSSGLRQLAVFTFAYRLVQEFPDALLLIDEPEVSLHPQAQRALVSELVRIGAQTLIATHSSNVLDGVDPRQVVRLYDDAGTAAFAGARALSDTEAERLARLSTPLTAEAFFARKVIFVEGISDLLAIRALAKRGGRNLDAEGISILSLDGGGGFDAYVKLLGPAGLKAEILGLCDADQEGQWMTWLEAAGFGTGLNRAAMEALGFFVCDRDLEDELITAIGVTDVLALIDTEGELSAFNTFAGQSAHASKPPKDQIRAFFRKQGRKARYAPLLVNATAPGAEPPPLRELLSRA